MVEPGIDGGDETTGHLAFPLFRGRRIHACLSPGRRKRSTWDCGSVSVFRPASGSPSAVHAGRSPCAEVILGEAEDRELRVQVGLEEVTEALVVLGVDFIVPLLHPEADSPAGRRAAESAVQEAKPSCSITSA